jgi:hypothetical protein
MLWLVAFTEHIVFKVIYVITCTSTLSLLMDKYSVVFIHHFVYLFIHWWAFGLFLPLAIVSNAAMNIKDTNVGMDIYIYIFLAMYLGVEVLSHKVIIWGSARVFSKKAAPFYVFVTSYERSSFSTPLLALVIRLLILAILLSILLLFWLAFPWWLMILDTFPCSWKNNLCILHGKKSI